MRTWVPLKSSRGSSLISVILAFGLMGLAMIGILSWNTQKANAGRQMNIQAVADQIKQRLVGAVISPNSWQITQARNTQAFSNSIFAQSGGMPTNYDLYPSLDLYVAGSTTAYYPATNPKSGFDIAGNPCMAFDAENGNDGCPFRYEVKLARHIFQNGNW
ncbi:MAG: type IV pilus modification PilV family protein, partial [Pseudobdellovibrionaceae bacterium]